MTVFELLGKVVLDNSSAVTGLNQTEKKASQTAKSMNKSMKNAGQSVTRNITGPILGIGAAVLKYSSDFEQGMLNVESLLGDQQKVLEETGLTYDEPRPQKPESWLLC